mmetsp:Transcript_19546/g.60251  ORF Transcript_19546/g.60251 Transcript_19546/m.60251 type:complete len:209 (+) Transcript_19546:493-1119(+)
MYEASIQFSANSIAASRSVTTVAWSPLSFVVSGAAHGKPSTRPEAKQSRAPWRLATAQMSEPTTSTADESMDRTSVKSRIRTWTGFGASLSSRETRSFKSTALPKNRVPTICMTSTLRMLSSSSARSSFDRHRDERSAAPVIARRTGSPCSACWKTNANAAPMNAISNPASKLLNVITPTIRRMHEYSIMSNASNESYNASLTRSSPT